MRMIISAALLIFLITGCTHSQQQFTFDHFVTGHIEKISVRNGAGVVHSTTDSATIHEFLTIMNSRTYVQSERPGMTGSSQLTFYGPNGKELAGLTFIGDYFYDGHNYYTEIPCAKLKNFYRELQTADNGSQSALETTGGSQ